MLRNKGLSEKVLLLGIDGMDPRFSRKMVDEGKMPNLQKFLKKGAARKDLRLLGAVPTITPPMWTTLATGAYPMTHGIEDFNINLKGELEVNFGGIYSTNCHAEQLWNITAEAGKKTLVWHWPGASWPPSSDNPNLMVVDGTSPGALGFCYASRDTEYIACASTKATEAKFYLYGSRSTEHFSGDAAELSETPIPFAYTDIPKKDYFDELWNQFKEGLAVNGYQPKKYMDMRTAMLMPGHAVQNGLKKWQFSVSLSPVTEPEGWANAPQDAKEFTLFQFYGHMSKPCLMLSNEQGHYDRVAIYSDKQSAEPIVILEHDVYTTNVPDVVPKGNTGELENVVRNMRLLDIAADGSFVRIWISNAFSADDNCVWYPHWIFDKIKERFGPPVPTGQISGGDMAVLRKCNIEQWRQAAKWQADAINYMIHEEDTEVVFSHFHGPDLSGHCYMPYLKNREDSPHPEEDFYQLHEETYRMTDEYIGEFLPLLDEGWSILIFSDHSLVCREGDSHDIGDNYGINTGVMQELGYTVLKKDDAGNLLPEIDWAHTRAVQQRSNSIFINLKGRDRFGIVDPADKYALEEQIITDLYRYTDAKTGHRIVSLALHQKDANLLGLGGDYTSGDIIFFIHDDYVFDHGEALSTATGHADTSVGPIFAAAGTGIKEGFEMTLFPREVDIAPTAAVLLGVRIPAQCEGAPIYTILSEEL